MQDNKIDSITTALPTKAQLDALGTAQRLQVWVFMILFILCLLFNIRSWCILRHSRMRESRAGTRVRQIIPTSSAHQSRTQVQSYTNSQFAGSRGTRAETREAQHPRAIFVNRTVDTSTDDRDEANRSKCSCFLFCKMAWTVPNGSILIPEICLTLNIMACVCK